MMPDHTERVSKMC